MRPTRSAFVSLVESYVGTPYVHLGRLPGVGLDCAGVPLCALIELGLPVDINASCGALPSVGQLESVIRFYADRVNGVPMPGDIVVTALPNGLGHIAVATSGRSVVYASSSGRGKVVRHASMEHLDIRSVWFVRGLES